MGRTKVERVIVETAYAEVDGRVLTLPISAAAEWFQPLLSDTPDGLMLVTYVVEDAWPENPMDELPDQGDCEYLEFRDGSQRNDWWAETLMGCLVCGDTASGPYHREPGADHAFDPPDNEWSRAFAEGRAFWVERYEHGLVRYALAGESSSTDRRWDVADGVAVLRLDPSWTDPEQQARDLLERYTSWCNGEAYGVCHAWFDQDHRLCGTEVCYGFLGWNDVEQAASAEHDDHAAHAMPDLEVG